MSIFKGESRIKPKIVQSKKYKNVVHEINTGRTFKLTTEGFIDMTNKETVKKRNGKTKEVVRVKPIKDISDILINPSEVGEVQSEKFNPSTQIVSKLYHVIEFTDNDFHIVHNFKLKNPKAKKISREYKPRVSHSKVITPQCKVNELEYKEFLELRAKIDSEKKYFDTVNKISGESTLYCVLPNRKVETYIGLFCEINLNKVPELEIVEISALDSWIEYNRTKYLYRTVLTDNWKNLSSYQVVASRENYDRYPFNNRADIKPYF